MVTLRSPNPPAKTSRIVNGWSFLSSGIQNVQDAPMPGLHSLDVTLLSHRGYRVDRALALN